MAYTVLQIVQLACAEMNLTQPLLVVGALDQQTQQLFTLLNACGYELTKEHEWQQLTQINTFTTVSVSTTGDTTAASAVITNIPDTSSIQVGYGVTGPGIAVAATVQSVDSATQVTLSAPSSITGTGETLIFGQSAYSLPSDFDRIIDNTVWDRTNRWPLPGPKTEMEWEWLKSGFAVAAPRFRWRILQNQFNMFPAPTGPYIIAYEYISNKWATASNGTPKVQFTADTDTCLFDDRLLITFLKKKFFEVKGFDTSMYSRDFNDRLQAVMADNKGAPILSYAQRERSIFVTPGNVQDGNWPL